MLHQASPNARSSATSLLATLPSFTTHVSSQSLSLEGHVSPVKAHACRPPSFLTWRSVVLYSNHH